MDVIVIYTDGSHFKHVKNGFIGYGAYCKYKNVEYQLSGECNDELLKRCGIAPGTKISNPTAEFLAFAVVLSELSRASVQNVPRASVQNVPRASENFKDYTLLFKIDYEGVGKWMRGEWKCKEIYIKKIKAVCDALISKYNFNVQIEYVPGHSNVYGNEMADKLAKNTESFSNFNQFKL